jgi:hypothetical protein
MAIFYHLYCKRRNVGSFYIRFLSLLLQLKQELRECCLFFGKLMLQLIYLFLENGLMAAMSIS